MAIVVPTTFALGAPGLTDAEKLPVEHRIAVRECTSVGLPRHIRTCARPEPELARLVTALSEVCA